MSKCTVLLVQRITGGVRAHKLCSREPTSTLISLEKSRLLDVIKRILIAFHRVASGSSFRARPDAPFLYSNENLEMCTPIHAIVTETKENWTETQYQDIHTKTNGLICAAIRRTTADVEE